MSGERLRIPIDGAYLHVVGLAAICFARLEWAAVYCTEKIVPGYVGAVSSKTAGQIANDLIGAANAHPDPIIVASLGVAAAEFKRLVGRRNDLVHANPGTSPLGEQRLFRHGAEWTIAEVESLADEFAAAELVLNDHYHNLL